MNTRRTAWQVTLCVLAVALLLLSGLPVTTASADSEFPQENAWTRATPSIVWCADPASTTTLEVHIVGRTDVRRVWITDMGTAAEEGRAELYDDGTHGDLTAGDRVFTLGGVVLPCYPDWLAGQGGYDRWMGMLRVELTDGTQTGNNYGFSVGTVHSDFKDFFQVQDFGGGLSATAYAFFIEDPTHQVMDGYPLASVTCGTENFEAYRKLYSALPDSFDFALVMPGMQIFRPHDLAENVPYDVLVSNAVQYIGMDIMDNTAQFGSAGRLKSAIYHSFGDLAIFDHEVAHTWGAAIGQSLGLISEDWDVNQGHWNKMTDIEGQLGAFYFDPTGPIGRFAYNGDETWHLVLNTEVPAYSPLELYIMGLIPPDEVPPIHILSAPVTSDLSNITASYRTVTIEQIIAAEGGVRSPSHLESQKEFNLAFIVTQDIPYNDAAYAYFSLLAHSLESDIPPEGCCSAPFAWATGGRATLSARLPLDLPDPFAATEVPSETGEPVTSTEPPTGETTAAPSAEPGPSGFPLFVCGNMLLVGLVMFFVTLTLLRRRAGI